MQIGGLQKLTLIDFPGRLAATVFLVGCSFRCPWCYSSELVLPEKIKSHPKIPEKYLFDFLKERKGLLEAVVICGGEPCLNKDLPQFCKKIKKQGYLVKLDTNGSNPEMLKKLIDKNLVDYVAMDIKAPLGAKSQIKSKIQISKYEKAVGGKVDLNKIKKSIEIIKNSGIDYEMRTTVVPGTHTKEDILQIAKDISPAKRYYLQNFRPEKTIDPKFEKIKPYPQEYILEILKAIAPFFEICQIR
jgi:pyruvate formate lyase activating enzyme